MSRTSIVFLAIFLINVAVVIHSKPALNDDEDWWKTATIYQIYPKSFKDSDEDGIGDLKGIIEKLDYLQDLGITAIWLSPIFKSPQFDEGYDISDFRDIDPIYGNLEIFQELLNKAHERGLKVVLDFVPNHTSNQHEWFQKALASDKKYRDYYVWAQGKNGSKTEPPNNWISVFKYSAWQWSEEQQAFYLHQFLKQQPDLNYFNNDVRQELKDVLSYWLDKYNVDGVRIDAVPHLVETKNLTDEPRTHDPDANSIDYNYLDHIYTRSQPESYEVVYEWRSHIDSISDKKSETKVCFTEAAVDINEVIPFYGSPDGTKLGAHFSFNFLLLGMTRTTTALGLNRLISQWLDKLPEKYTSNWVLGNHDNHRIATKVGNEKIDILNLVSGFLPGVQVTYNGEEIGMENGEVSCEEGDDKADNCTIYPTESRDFERTPIQWDNSEFAGFTNGSNPWLPVSDKKAECNVADQLKDPRSHLSVYKKLQEIRKTDSFKHLNTFRTIGKTLNGLVIERRNRKTKDHYELLINFGPIPLVNETFFANEAEVLISSQNSKRNWGDKLIGEVDLDGYETLLIKK